MTTSIKAKFYKLGIENPLKWKISLVVIEILSFRQKTLLLFKRLREVLGVVIPSPKIVKNLPQTCK